MSKNPKINPQEIAELLSAASKKLGMSESEILSVVGKGDFGRLTARVSPKDRAEVAQMLQSPSMAALIRNNPKAAAFVQSFMKEGK